MNTHATFVLTAAIAASLLACGGGTTLQVNSAVSDLHAQMEKAGCTKLGDGNSSTAWMMKCPDGSKFFLDGANSAIVCEGSASGEEACAAAVRKFGGTPGSKL